MQNFPFFLSNKVFQAALLNFCQSVVLLLQDALLNLFVAFVGHIHCRFKVGQRTKSAGQNQGSVKSR
jgi:hypothetical protein